MEISVSIKSYVILERDSGKVLKSGVSESDLISEVDCLIESGLNISFLPEEAAAGSVSAGSIAVRFDGKSQIKPLHTIKAFMDDFNSRVTNRFNPKNVSTKDFTIKIDEAFDMDSVFSRLGSMERAGSKKKTEGTTFGIEDDNGNIMRVTVRAEQAKEFEEEVAKYIADIKMNLDGLPSPKEAKELSMAELLFNLKDKFDIIDVDFPKIPKDVIYNADKASVGAPTTPTETDDGMPAEDMADEFEDSGEPLDLTDFEEDGESSEGEAEFGDTEGDEMFDDESVEDFVEEPESDESSILTKVIDMLKAQAESDIERAKAEAEKARAEQARYTAQATQNAIKDEEEALRYEVEMEEQKRREKEAQKRIDMAKHRISKTMSASSGAFSESFAGVESTRSVMNDKRAIMLRWRPEPDDTPERIAEKRAMQQEELRIWAARMRMARRAESIDAKNKRSETEQNKKEQNVRQPQDSDATAPQTRMDGQQAQPQAKKGF